MRTASVAAAIAIAVGAGVARPGTVSASPAEDCGFQFTYSAPTVLKPLIWGYGAAECNEPPAFHVVELTLERRDTGGMWTARSTSRSSAIPDPKQDYQASVECEPGLWRITVHITGSMQSNPFNFTDQSRQRAVDASECPRG
jgi:hypothetical protein